METSTLSRPSPLISPRAFHGTSVPSRLYVLFPFVQFILSVLSLDQSNRSPPSHRSQNNSGLRDGVWNRSPAYDLVPEQTLLPSGSEELALTLSPESATDPMRIRNSLP